MWPLGHDAQLFLLVIDKRIWRDTLHEKDVAADCRSCSDHRLTAKNGRVRINGHVVLDLRMTFAAFLDLAVFIFLEAARAERNAVIKFYARTNFGSFADHDAGSVIDKKMGGDFRAWVNVDAGAAVRPFGHDAGNKGHFVVKFMRHSINRDRFERRIREDDFLVTFCGGITFVSGIDVGPKNAAQLRQFRHE